MASEIGPGNDAPRPQRHVLARAHWPFLLPVLLFSLCANLLMLAVPLYSMQIYDRVLPTRSDATLVVLTGLMLGLVAAVMFLDAVRGRIMAQFAILFAQQLSPFAIRVSLAGGTDAQGGGPLNDVDVVRRTLQGPLAVAGFDAPWSVLFFIVMFGLHPMLGTIGIVGALMLVVTSLIADARLRRANHKDAALERETRAQLREFSRDHGALRAMGIAETLEARLLDDRARQLDLELEAGNGAAVNRALSRGFRMALQLAALGAAAHLAVHQEIPAGAIIAASLLLGRALTPLDRLAGGWSHVLEAVRAWRRLMAIATVQTPERRTQLPTVRGRIQLENVTLRHRHGSPPLLPSLSLAVEEGETLAIVGSVGVGKSSLCRLLAGVEAPTSGEIRIDGALVTHWDSVQWGASIGFLMQEVHLLRGTIATNIARGGVADDAAVVAAARLAGAHDAILALPDAYQTRITDARVRLSSGERQLIGLARAFYGQPRLLILDEPTFHLDDAAERQLVAALHQLKQAGVTIVLASRSSSLLHLADHLLMLRRGQPAAFRAHAAMSDLLRPRLAVERGTPANGHRAATAAAGEV